MFQLSIFYLFYYKFIQDIKNINVHFVQSTHIRIHRRKLQYMLVWYIIDPKIIYTLCICQQKIRAHVEFKRVHLYND